MNYKGDFGALSIISLNRNEQEFSFLCVSYRLSTKATFLFIKRDKPFHRRAFQTARNVVKLDSLLSGIRVVHTVVFMALRHSVPLYTIWIKTLKFFPID